MVKIMFEEPAETSAIDASSIGLEFTENAAKRVLKIIERKGEEGLMLRLTIKGGGCSGYSYFFDLTKEMLPNDITISNESTPDVKLLIDPASYNFVQGSKVDYVETLETAQFVVENPNATTSCGCGNSFSV